MVVCRKATPSTLADAPRSAGMRSARSSQISLRSIRSCKIRQKPKVTRSWTPDYGKSKTTAPLCESSSGTAILELVFHKKTGVFSAVISELLELLNALTVLQLWVAESASAHGQPPVLRSRAHGQSLVFFIPYSHFHLPPSCALLSCFLLASLPGAFFDGCRHAPHSVASPHVVCYFCLRGPLHHTPPTTHRCEPQARDYKDTRLTCHQWLPTRRLRRQHRSKHLTPSCWPLTSSNKPHRGWRCKASSPSTRKRLSFSTASA